MAEDVAQPKRVGGFELLEQVGAGGMGTIWKARQLSLDRVVALKLLASAYSQNAEFLTRFRNEARAAANLTHRHIVQVYDAGKADGVDYLAMEYVEGKTARAKLEAQGMMSETEVLDTIIPIAQALQYAWEHAKLIHRDVKPDNIIIDQDGTVKLLDLGLAKSLTTSENLKITKSGQALGTAFYISPEQAEARGDLDLRTDIYGLGATTYHMLTGKAPFEDLATAAAMLQHVEGVLADARTFQPQLSEGLCMVIERMMAKDREDRYQSWQQLIADLQLVRGGRRPVNARIAPGRSTMQRRENVEPGWRGAPLPEAGPLIHVEAARHMLTPVMWAGIGVTALCLLGIVLLLVMSQQHQQSLRAELESQKMAAQADAAARAYYEAVEFARARPQEFGEIIKRFHRVSVEFA
ncbi:MAG: serine/threonine protein kinase, partial [Verrucomicrobia bacterium]|nr:serine/threonine protein kinase [Verrucomicrobiota bacterium]